MPDTAPDDIAAAIGSNLPFLRRYSRALTGSQTTGDNYALATLEAILEDTTVLDPADAKVGLFRAFHLVWSSAGAPLGEAEGVLSLRAQEHMESLTPNSREALLLHAIEGFDEAQIGEIPCIE